MRTIGYAESSCMSGQAAKDVYDNLRVKAAIARIDDKTVKRSEYDIDACDTQYSEIITLAIRLKQPSAAVSAITGRARLRGWDKDNEIGNKAPEDISDEQAKRWSEMAAIANQERIAGPKLAKEA